MNDNMLIKIRNMIEHLAVGDALGKICSKYNRKELIEIYGHEITSLVKPIRRASKYEWVEGSITDDTILTFLVADSLIANRRFNRRDIGLRLIACDPRGGTQIAKLKESHDPEYMAVDGETNGAAIRVLPLAVTRENLTELTNNVIELSTLTHGGLESISGALLTAYSQFYVLNNSEERYSFQFLTNTVYEHYPNIFNTIIWENVCKAFDIAKNVNRNELYDILEKEIGYDKYSWSSIPTALAIGFHSDNNYQSLIQLIHRNKSGGDLDTVASIAGSLLGGIRADYTIADMAKKIETANSFSFQKYADELYCLRNVK
ncbi:TPA: hypothetical protein ENS27_19960 [bacterium]|nr:hypothetical protein [bacterium]